MLEPEINQVIVFGDRRPHLVALIVPETEFLKDFARARGKTADPADLAGDPEFRRAIGDAVGRANDHLSVIERIRNFEIMPGPFTIEDGSMTPTLKLRRQIIYQRHADLFEALYQPRGSERAARSQPQ
jgi:long-chain acyl-CoA synthetase